MTTLLIHSKAIGWAIMALGALVAMACPSACASDPATKLDPILRLCLHPGTMIGRNE